MWLINIRKKMKKWMEFLFLKKTTFFSKILAHPIKYSIIIFILVYIFSIFATFYSFVYSDEGNNLNLLTNFKNAIYLTAPAAFGSITGELAGFGSYKAIILMVCVIMNIFFLGIILAYSNDYVRNLSLQGGRIEKYINCKGHIVICGWNYQGKDILDSILSKDIHSRKQIVVLADYEKRPFKHENVIYIKGSPENPNDLDRANIKYADSAIILTDIPIDEYADPDKEAFIITTLIRNNIAKNANISVQLLSTMNEELLNVAGANTVVCLDKLGGSILAFSSEYNGILEILKEILFSQVGSNIYRCKITELEDSDKYLGKTFTEVGKNLLDKKMILLAIETEENDNLLRVCKKDFIQEFIDFSGKENEKSVKKVMLVNPQGEFTFNENDYLFIISEKKPFENELSKKEAIANENFVICGWNLHGDDIIKTLEEIGTEKITVFTDNEIESPEKLKGVTFVNGSPLEMKPEDVEKARLNQAESVIILPKIPNIESNGPDDKAFIITTLIRGKINKHSHISVQLLSSDNEKRLKIAGADTIICPDVLAGLILAFSAQYHGTLNIIKELLYTFEGSEIYKWDKGIPEDLCINFFEVGKKLLDKKMVLVAFETVNDKHIRDIFGDEFCQTFAENVLFVNPQEDYELRKNDCLFIISEEEPTKLW